MFRSLSELDNATLFLQWGPGSGSSNGTLLIPGFLEGYWISLEEG